jgi:putative ABC transport system permease protein
MGEFGTMMALGNRSSDIFRMIMIENALLGVLGSTIGLAVGVVLALIISAIGIPMPPPPNANMGYIAHIQVVPSTLLISFSIGILATVLAAVFPARHVSRVQVVEALRQNL